MKFSFIVFLIILMGCQTQKKDIAKIEKSVKTIREETSDIQQYNIQCNQEVCIHLRNHDASNKSFDIYMLNSVPVAGFQCDFLGINIIGSDGGLLTENEYQINNSANRILSFSMQAKLIPIGEGVLTTIRYTDTTEEICMTEIIFAGMGGQQLSNNLPECMKLN